MKITKGLLILALFISALWALDSKFEFEPILVFLGFFINLISISIEEKIQRNKLNISESKNSADINQSNKGGTEQENILEVGGQIGTITQINE